MQSNITGKFMEVLLFSVMSLFTLINTIFLLRIIDKVKFHEMAFDAFQKEHLDILSQLVENFSESDEKIVQLSNQLDRSLLALKDQPAKPMKTNNWDSIRDTFKTPARAEVNE